MSRFSSNRLLVLLGTLALAAVGALFALGAVQEYGRMEAALVIGVDREAYLWGEFYPLLALNGAVFLGFALAVVFLLLLARRALAQAERAREAQSESERLCCALVRQLPNGRVAVVDRSGRYLVAGGQGFSNHPSFSAEKIIGRTVAEVYPPEAAAVIESLIEAAFAGREAEAELADAGEFYKVIAVPLSDEGGALDQCMLLTQDVTEFKQAQEALAVLSATDGLLEIANRREFERVLGVEWRRAAREGQPLAVLLLDVDCFKLYNDTYGHPAGDACLQEVAGAVQEALERAGDLVARYGGEELVVLLPATDLAGALRVAERIHASLAARELAFEVSPVAEQVTLSIGAAAMQPQEGGAAVALVAEADRGVYAAKENGRNRTCTAPEEPRAKPARRRRSVWQRLGLRGRKAA